MNFTPQSATQRIQVGLIGLVSVLLFVSIANMIFDQSYKDAGVQQKTANSEQGPGKIGESRDEPLAELGVAPAVAEQEKTAKQALPAPTPDR
jgi:hypothetical protein